MRGIIPFSLWAILFTFQVFGTQLNYIQNPNQNKLIAKSFNHLIHSSYQNGIDNYNELSSRPEEIFRRLNLEQRQLMSYLLEKYQIKKLPKWKTLDGINFLKMGSITIISSSSLFFEGKFKISENEFYIKKNGETSKKNLKRLINIIKENKNTNFSFLDLLVSKAFANGCGDLCASTLTASLIGTEIIASEELGKTFNGDNNDLEKKVLDIESSTRSCNEKIRTHDQEQFPEISKLIESFSAMIKSDTQRDSDDYERLQSSLLEHFKINSFSCREFSRSVYEERVEFSLDDQKQAEHISEIRKREAHFKNICTQIDSLISCLSWFKQNDPSNLDSNRMYYVPGSNTKPLNHQQLPKGRSIFR